MQAAAARRCPRWRYAASDGDRLGDHGLEQATICLLDLGAAGELGVHVSQARGECIAHALEISEAENTRPPGGADAPVEVLAREGLGEDAAELGLQTGDLTAKVAASQQRPSVTVAESSRGCSSSSGKTAQSLTLNPLGGQPQALPRWRSRARR